MNNKPNNNLNNFLNKNKQSLDDDFEKDAFAGFESIESKEEALNIKATLDKKISTTLFSEKKRYFDSFSSHNKTVWYAAASLILVIGLSVLYIFNNADSIVKTNDVSMVDTKKEAVETKPETESTPNIPTNSATSTSVIEDIKLEEKNKDDLNRIADSKMITKNAPKEEVQSSDELKAPDKSNKQEPKKSENSDLDNLALSKKGSTEAAGMSSNSTGGANVNDKITATNTSPVTVGGVTTRETKKLQKEDEKPLSETVVTNNNTSTTKSSSKDMDDKESDSKKDESFATSTNSPKKDSKSKERKKNRAAENQPVSAAAEQSKAPENNKNNETPKTTVDAKSIANQCYYSGGNIVLQNEVTEKLITKNVNKKFDAVLFINEKKQVEKINFINAYNLNANDKKTIESELKTLNKFDFFISPTTKILFEFKLEYRP